MKMKHPHLQRAGITAAVLIASASALIAAPTVSRLTPPSALFSFGDAGAPYTARFLTGQRFDLQATLRPEVGNTITSVEFKVDGVPVGNAPGLANTSLVTTGLLATLPANSAVASLRGYSNLVAGVHTFTATATQSDATTTTVTGNFEIIATTVQGKKAKNIIVLIGDGMGASHRTAARIMLNGYAQGKANAPLAMDKMPFTGILAMASLDSIVPDSAPGAACYSTGNKSNNNQQGVFPDDTINNGDNPRVELIGEYLARTQGKSLGIVTTADVFDATPAAFGSHTQARSAGMGICDNYLDEMVPKANLTVLLGGGRKWFLPNGTLGTARTGAANDYAIPTDIVSGWGLPTGGVVGDTARDLLTDFTTAGFTYAPDKMTMTGVAAGATKLLGLFNYSNMNIALDKIDGRRGTASPTLGTTVVNAYGFPDQPMLDEMTDAALTVLKKNTNGFVLMVEGASIDKQAHNMDTERWILDTIEFDYAVEKCRQFQAANPDTLVLVTADHECAGVAIIGGSRVTDANLAVRAASGLGTAVGGPRNGVVGTYQLAGFPNYIIAGDGYPTTTNIDYRMLIGYAANADRNEDWRTNELPLRDSQHPTAGPTPYGSISALLPNLPTNRDVAGGFLVTGQVEDTVAAHTGGDIPLSAQGRGAKFFTGTMDNTDVFFKAMQAAIGGASN